MTLYFIVFTFNPITPNLYLKFLFHKRKVFLIHISTFYPNIVTFHLIICLFFWLLWLCISSLWLLKFTFGFLSKNKCFFFFLTKAKSLSDYLPNCREGLLHANVHAITFTLELRCVKHKWISVYCSSCELSLPYFFQQWVTCVHIEYSLISPCIYILWPCPCGGLLSDYFSPLSLSISTHLTSFLLNIKLNIWENAQ